MTLAVAAVSPVAMAQQSATRLPESACTDAAYLVEHGRLSDARSSYLELLRLDKRLSCAARGLGRVAERHARARQVRQRGDEAAEAAGKARGKADAQRLRAEAARDFKAAASLDASLKQQPERGRESRLGAVSDWLQQAAKNIFGFLSDVGSFVLAVATAVALIAAVLLVVGRLPAARKFGRLQTRGLVTPLSKPDSVPRKALRWLYGVEFTIKANQADDDKQASTLHAQLQDAFGASSTKLGAGVDLMAPPASGGDALADLADALKDVPQGKAAAALLRLGGKALPRDAFFLSGALLPGGERGRGLTLVLATRRGQLRYTATLWEDTYSAAETEHVGSDEAIYRLAVAGAAWSEFKVFDHRHDRLRLRPLLGTRDWESYAYLMTGIVCRDAGLDREAGQLFARAASTDSQNVTAMLNLSVLELGPDTRQRAIERLKRSIELLLERPCTEGDTDPRSDPKREARVRVTDREHVVRDPRWFAAQYNLALAHLMDFDAGNPAALELAWQAAGAQVASCERAVRGLKDLCELAESGAAAALTRSRLQLLRRIQGPSLALLASILVESPGEAPGERGSNVMRDVFLLRLAATHVGSTASESRDNPGGKPPLTAAYVIEDYLPVKAECNDRTEFNVACYYTRLARKHDRTGKSAQENACLDTALARLRAAAATGVLGHAAQSDPALAHLRTKRGRAFLNAIGVEAPDARSPLARLAAIGPTNAETLAAVGISSISDLLDHACRRDDRWALANASGLPPTLLAGWARLVELLALEGAGIRPEDANLLEAAQLGTLDRLAAQRPDKLIATLTNVSVTCGVAQTVPERSSAARWIRAARASQTRVE